MANWPDELKLQYISIQLQEDAYRWWNQSTAKITTWSCFVEAIKQAFGPTKLKELTFEQLRTYKQAINQSNTQYYDKVIELCKRVHTSMTDSMKLQYLLVVEDTLSLTNTDYNLNQDDNHQNTNYNRQPITSTINPRQDVDQRRIDVHQSQLQTSTSVRMNNSRNNNVSYSSLSKNTMSKKIIRCLLYLWNFRTLFTGLCPFPFPLMEASIDGVASKNQYENPSQRTYVPLIYLNAYAYDKQMKLMIDTGTNRTFI
ncbi:unnamed protein product [Rotaria sp. Silwood2]|nr:unnamed protein product [Rotaria sp. Silwood2]CAF4428106.1 unnamed protein product [Rotaria sp. Silwood2]